MCFRIFSLRRSHDLTPEREGGMHPLTEEEETVLGEREGPTLSPPILPPTPLFMPPEQTKRRFILNSLIQSENNYLGKSLKFFYKKIVSILPKKWFQISKVRSLSFKVYNIRACIKFSFFLFH